MSDHKPGLLLREGVLVAAFPAVVYLCSYLYEFGFARYFRIPAAFIAVELRVLLKTAIGLSVIVAVALAMASLLAIRYKPSEHPSLLVLRRFGPLLLVGGFIHLQVRPLGWRWMLATLLCVLWLSLDWLAPLFEGDKRKRYKERFARRQEKIESKRGFLGRHLGTSEYTVVVLLVSFFVLLAASYQWGIGDARKKKQFMVASQPPGAIVLGIYGNKIVLGQRDKQTSQLSPQRIVVVLSDKAEFRFNFEKIESLSVERPEGEDFWKYWH